MSFNYENLVQLKSFHSLDFGVKSGRQVGDKCEFNFNSNESMTGVFQ